MISTETVASKIADRGQDNSPRFWRAVSLNKRTAQKPLKVNVAEGASLRSAIPSKPDQYFLGQASNKVFPT